MQNVSMRALPAALLAAAALHAAPQLQDAFRYQREVRWPDTAADTIVRVIFDSHIHEATRPGYPDVRLFDADGQQTPGLVEKLTEAKTDTVRRYWRSNIVSLTEREGNRVEIVVERDPEDKDAPRAVGIRFRTPLRNYEQHVRVAGWDEAHGWRPLVADGLIFDYSRFMDISNAEVSLPANDCRRFKIEVDNITDERASPLYELTREQRSSGESARIERQQIERRPFRVDRLAIWGERQVVTEKQDQVCDYPVPGFDAETDEDTKATVITVMSRQEPLTAFVLETSSRNFSRTARVEVQERGDDIVRDRWRVLGSATLSRVRFGGYAHEELRVKFPETRVLSYRLTIDNGDSPPLAIDGIRAEGNVYALSFLAPEGGHCSLCYGSENAAKPTYDLAAVLAPLRQGHEPVAGELGEVAENPRFRVPGFWSGGVGSPWFFGIVVALMVAALAWGLFRAGRRMGDLPPADE